jgi:hypothetical protein
MNLAGASLLAIGAILVATPLASAQNASAKFVNHSSVDIHHVYLSPHGADAWGPDRLGRHVLEPGDALELSGLSCNLFDFQLVDQDEHRCTLRNVKLCKGDAVFDLTDTALALCRHQR